MLAGLLLAGIASASLSTVGLLAWPARWLAGTWVMWAKRLTLALIGTGVLALAGATACRLLTRDDRAARASLLLLAFSSLIWLPLTRRWNARAHLCWSFNVYLFAAYLVFMAAWTFQSPLGAYGKAGAGMLWALEAFAALLGCAYLWELCDALGSEHWERRSLRGATTEEIESSRPFVSLHVPAHEEPPDMVIETLRTLRNLHYDDYEIICIDDNTADETLWRPVEAWCAQNDVKFLHLEDWPGYKSGALNVARTRLTDPRAEVIGVIDSDYQIEPGFLASCAPMFEDPTVGFIQAPQDYREWSSSSYFRRLYYSYRYFFAVSQPSRNERNGAIFAGTMGLIRRRALDEVGGWDEWCITEDAELSLRLLRAGWSGIHVDASFGHGVMPLTFEALKGQRFRWCFGGIQVLRMHWRSMLPGRNTDDNRLTGGQRWAYLSGALQWYGDLLSVVFFLFLLGGSVNIALGGGLLFRKLSGFLIAAIPMLVVLGFVRAVALIRRGTGATWSDAIGAFFVWQSTSLVVARASVQALFAHKAEFLRTPKTAEQPNLWKAVTGNPSETVMAFLGLGGIAVGLAHANTLSGTLTAILLALPTIAFASAPFNSLSAQRAALSPQLSELRSAETRRGYSARRTATAAASVTLVGATAALAIGLLIPGGQHVAAPTLVQPSDRPKAGPANPTPTRAVVPASPTTTSPTASISASPSPTSSPSPTTPPTVSTSPTSSPTGAVSAPASTSTSSPTP